MFYLLGFAIQHFNCRHYRVALSLSLPRGLIILAGYYGLSSLYEDEKILLAAGFYVVFNIYLNAGAGLAEQSIQLFKSD